MNIPRSRKSINIDKDLIIILLLIAITGFIYFFVTNQRAFLNIFYIPVLLGSYFFGLRYALTAAVSAIVLVIAVAVIFPDSFSAGRFEYTEMLRWIDIVTWCVFLLFTAYLMGILNEKKEKANRELRKIYNGIIEMLSLVLESADHYTQSHSYRVSKIAELMAREMGMEAEDTENIRVAALLHDIGKMRVSGEILHKAGSLTSQESSRMKQHAWNAVNLLEPLGSRVGSLLPLILHHHEKYDGSGYYNITQQEIPLGARIIAVADVYDALTTDRPYRKAFSPLQAKQEIQSGAGTHFDPDVVAAFQAVFPYIEKEGHLSSP
jgi:putative nucleotidyltransferase with HDIG domain